MTIKPCQYTRVTTVDLLKSGLFRNIYNHTALALFERKYFPLPYMKFNHTFNKPNLVHIYFCLI